MPKRVKAPPSFKPCKLHWTNYPEDLLREFAVEVLEKERVSTSFLEALRHVLGSMSLADRLGRGLWLSHEVDFTSKHTMGEIAKRLHKAGLAHEVTWLGGNGHPHDSIVYYGRLPSRPDDSRYSRIQREQEEVDFTRYLYSVGVHPDDCPY